MIAYAVEQPTRTHNDIEFERYKWETISLYDFVCEFWEVIEHKRAFVPGQHIEAICEHLEAVIDGKITRLIVNMPPRHAKSSIISVLFRAWAWIKNPSTRFLCASYALSLATRDNVKVRRLILSSKFQAHYGHLFTLTKDQNAKIKFENDKRGASQAVSVGSSATGEGFDIGIIDDPHSIDETRSDVTREGTLEWFKDVWCTRLNDPKTSAMIVVGQRVHGQDLSGYILSGETGEHWVWLNLATEFEPSDRCVTHLPDGRKFWEDWRELEGELLWPDRFPAEVVERAKRRHGPIAYAALYQQRPVPAGGNIFNIGNERLFTIDHEAGLYLLETPRGIKPVPISECWTCTTSDVAAKEKEQNDWTVFATWAITPMLDILLLDVKRGHWSIPEQKDQGYKVYQEFNGPNYQCLYFEDVGYQSAIGQELIIKGVPCLPFSPGGQGDKVLRASAASIWQQLGKLYFLSHVHWLADWRTELYGFPKEAHDDQVDNASMICLIVRKPAPLSDGRRDEEDVPAAAEETGGLIPLTVPLKATPEEQAEALQLVEATKKPIDPFVWAEQLYGGDW